jgi:hypothetical protein
MLSLPVIRLSIALITTFVRNATSGCDVKVSIHLKYVPLL